MPFHFTAYGLSVASERALPELRPLDEPLAGEPDVEIVWRSLGPPVADGWLHVDGEVVTLRFGHVSSFRVVGGRRIEVEPGAESSEETVRVPLLGAAAAALLQQRGLFSLHASAVDIGGRAAIFVGEKGQGKSTLASSLYGRGHDLLADDIAVVTGVGEAASTLGAPVVRPGFPQLKVASDSLRAALGMGEDEVPRVSPLIDKHAHRVRERFAQSDVPLGRVYILTSGDWNLGPMPPQLALAQVLAHSYAARFGHRLLSGEAAGRHMATCARLVSGGWVRELCRPRDLDLLGEVARRVEEDVARA